MFNVEIYRNVDSAFYPILHESFSNSYGFALFQEFNPFYPHLVLHDRKHFFYLFVYFFVFWNKNVEYLSCETKLK